MFHKKLQSYLAITAVVIFSTAAFSGCFTEDSKKKDAAVVTAQTIFTVSGSVNGLHGTLKLKNNNANELTVTSSGSFSFTTTQSANEFYDVTISSEPTNQLCEVSNGGGVISGSDITNITVDCVAREATLRTFTGGEATLLAQCSGCHPLQYNKWIESGHGYKMNKVNGTIPTFPFTNVSAMFPAGGVSITYTQLTPTSTVSVYTLLASTTSYIIGGFGWKARYFNANGELHYGAGAQYNLEDTSFTAYNNNNADADGKKNYNCGFCHTTGWMGITGNNINYATGTRKDLLPNMDGDWSFSGVACQRCHGTLASGSDVSGGTGHNTKSMKANVYDPNNWTTGEGGNAFGTSTSAAFSTAANSVCAECHLRDNYINKVDMDKSKILAKHHEQSQELYVGRHGNTSSATTEGNGTMGCVTCHDPHSSVKHDSKAKGEGTYKSKVANGNCAITCHNSKSSYSSVSAVMNSTPITVKAPYSTAHTCVDCHMPYIVSTAITINAAGNGVPELRTKVTGVTALGIPSTGNKRGDMRTHIVALTGNDSFFASGTTAFLDGTSSQVKIPVGFSCMTCHGTGGAVGPTTSAEAASQLLSYPVH